MADMLIPALMGVFDPISLILLVLGVSGGILVGALPGLTATMAIALLVPFTFGMSPIHGLVLLGAIYSGAIYGGSFSAILINTPGTPSAIATTFDGFPMAQKGEAYRAIVTATIASVFGGIIGVAFLIFPLAASGAGQSEFRPAGVFLAGGLRTDDHRRGVTAFDPERARRRRDRSPHRHDRYRADRGFGAVQLRYRRAAERDLPHPRIDRFFLHS
jgi:hypothetical protein